MGGGCPEAGWLSADRFLQSHPSGTRRAGLGRIHEGALSPSHILRATRPPTPPLQMGDLRALPASMRKALPSLDIRERGHLERRWSMEEGCLPSRVLFCGD